MKINNHSILEKLAFGLIKLVGTPTSIVIHSLFFIGVFSLLIFGYSFSHVLLFLTTILSIEAIYLALFIQMTINETSKSLKEIEEDVDDIQEDIEDLDEDVEEITDDIKEIEDIKTQKTLKDIEIKINDLQKDLKSLKERGVLNIK